MKTISLILIFATMTVCCSMLSSCDKEDMNSDPTVSILKTDPAEIHANGLLSVLSAASDPDGDEISFSYEVSGGTVTGAGTLAFWTVPSSAGEYTITVKADDGNGGTDSFEKTVTVSAPVTQISGIGALQGTGADLKDSQVLLFNVYPSTGFPYKKYTLTGSGTKVVFNLTGFEAGDYYILLWKDVDKNGSASMGDLVGWYGDGDYHSPNYFKIQVGEGQTFCCDQLKTYVAN
ncbi:hypothetical protein DSECCO2_370950 [anaerobic digester metagenome]